MRETATAVLAARQQQPLRGTFITFEGGEGAGKSTQIERLADRLRDVGIKVTVTREPGGTRTAEAIRKLVLSGGAEHLGPEGEAILFAAARADHVDQVIRPVLAKGEWVLCDRFVDSTRAYQGAVGGADQGLLRALERIAVGRTWPDLTIVLDIPVRVGQVRVARRLAEARARGDVNLDRFERESRARQQRRRQAFLRIARSEPDRCVVIDGSEFEDQVADEVWQVVSSRFLDQAA